MEKYSGIYNYRDRQEKKSDLFIKELSEINLSKKLTSEIFINSLNKSLILESSNISSLEKNIIKLPVFRFTTVSIPTIPRRVPDLRPVIPHIPRPGDFGYTYLLDPRERRRLLEEAVRIVSDMESQRVNVTVFCDRGARPLATLVAQIWPVLSEKPMPALFFINTDPKRTYGFDAGAVPHGDILDLRRWLLEEYPDGKNPFRDSDARVCVVDENRSTGKSARFVEGVVGRALGDRVQSIYCDWAEIGGAALVWRNRADLIGAETQNGKFKSRRIATRQAEMLQYDLIRLAQSYQAAARA